MTVTGHGYTLKKKQKNYTILAETEVLLSVGIQRQHVLGSSASYLQNSLFAFAVLVFKLFRSRAIRECEYVENCSDAVINCNFIVNKCCRISLDVFA